MTIITSKDNPSVRLYTRLASSKKERKNYGMFVLEGYRLIYDALNEHAHVSQIFFTEEAYDKYYFELSQVDLKEVKIIIISNELGMKISCTEKTQGIFAVCNVPQSRDLKHSLKTDGRYVVLYQLQDPGNLGMIIRTADAMGIDGVILSESCELYNPKTIRSTMGSAFRINIFEECDIDEILNLFRSSGIKSYAAVIDKDASDLRKCSFSGGSAVLIGNEGNGLPAEASEKCDEKLTIKMTGNVNSLNAAMAAGIILWEMVNSK